MSFLPTSHHLKPRGPHNVVLVAHIIMVPAVPPDRWWWTGHSALKHMNLPSEFEPDGFGMVSDIFMISENFWKLGLGMLPPFLCYQNAHTFHWSLFRSANHQESILQKRNHSNYPGCCPHEILSGSLQYWSSKFTQKLYRKVRFDYQKVILIKPYPKSICEATQRRSDIPAQWAQMGPDGPSLPLKAIELDGPAPCCRSKIIGLVVSSGHRPPEPPSSVGLAGFPGPVSFRLPLV